VVRRIVAPQGAVGSDYSFRIPNNVFRDPDGDMLSYRVRSLPLGLSFNGTDTLRGTPLRAGTYPIELVARDPNNEMASTAFTIEIRPRGFPILRKPIPTQIAAVGKGFEFKLTEQFFEDTAAVKSSLNYEVGDLPTWLTFADATFSGKPGPDDTGDTITVTVINANGKTNVMFRISVGLRVRAKVYLEGPLQ